MRKPHGLGPLLGIAGIFALGLGLGWAGAAYRATHEMRARDVADFDAAHSRAEAEEMRLLDLDPGQRRTFLAAREEARREMFRVLGRSRPELDGILRRSDQKIRPVLSPRQLAIYDRLETALRRGLPERPAGADD
ncbi:MAG: hypothetical protein AAGU21_11725 [Solidesulfovibrio sp.]|uniref:hypothetical protein n=1 Tax=Solidesulfovibrio sp. TaxID=2910990 RepID=UPI002B2215B1|nr:hypothetical protein [Solidesulfovibrio sp.]MEA4857301.1 hypothetical protein [Solidesulfovibrio sp.]